MQKMLTFILITISIANCEIITFPMNTFQVDVQEGELFQVSLEWEGDQPEQMQVYIYNEGMNLLQQEVWRAQITYYSYQQDVKIILGPRDLSSNGEDKQMIEGKQKQLSNGEDEREKLSNGPSLDLEEGKYYFRVGYDELDQYEPVLYEININVGDGRLQINQNGLVYPHRQSYIGGETAMSIEQISDVECETKMYYSNFPSIYFVYYPDGSYIDDQNNQAYLINNQAGNMQLNIKQNGVWYFTFAMLRSNQQVSTIITRSQFGLQHSSNGCVSDEEEEEEDGVNIGIIIGVVVVVVMIIGSVVIFLLMRRRKKQKEGNQKQVNRMNGQSHNQMQSSSKNINELNIKQTIQMSFYRDNCTICLGDDPCDCYLPCKHIFHEDCIKDWLRKDQSCPTCRKPLHIKQIVHKSNLKNI